jgi:hypothetical protein
MSGAFDRRRFIAGASAAAVSGSAVAAAVLSSEVREDDELATGQLSSVVGPADGVVSLVANGQAQHVRLKEGAHVFHGREGMVENLSPFVPGEAVVLRAAAGDRGAVWSVSAFESLFTGETGRVTALSPGRVVTEAGPIVLPSSVSSAQPEITLGSLIHVALWTDPRSGDRYARRHPTVLA